MLLLRAGRFSLIHLLVIIVLIAVPALSGAQEYKVFTSEEYGFMMKYPAAWVKIDRPKGNYYVVFQAPDMVDNFRSRIHVAAHTPVKDPLSVFLQELRNGITDLQKKSGTPKDKQEVQIEDEGEFKSEIPGAYYFFIRAYESNLKLWMGIVIVFFKHEQTLLRISCLAPLQQMDSFYKTFNDVLVSVKFAGAPGKPAQPAMPGPAPSPAPTYQQPQPAAPGAMQQPQPAPAPPRPTVQPAQPAPAQPQVQPAPGQPQVQPYQPVPATPRPSVQPAQPAPAQPLVQPPSQPTPGQRPQLGETGPARPPEQPAQAPRPVPRGPLRSPEGPATGIVN